MSPEELVVATLNAAAPVTALVGDRIFPDEIPQERALPAIVYRRAATDPRFTLNDTLAATRALMRLSCWATSRLQAETIGDAAVAALVAQKIMPVGRDGFSDPETGEEAALLEVEVWL
jgi:hypothetical protein